MKFYYTRERSMQILTREDRIVLLPAWWVHGAMQHVMIITKWQLRQGFINSNDAHNTAIHEFAHLIDKMDGTMDGVPEIILERKYTDKWKKYDGCNNWANENLWIRH